LKVRLEDIPPEGREETFIREEDWLDERLSGEKTRVFRFRGPITVRLHLLRSGDMVVVRSRIEVPMDWTCARCLDPYSQDLMSQITTTFKPRPSTPWPEEMELTRDEVETEYYDGDELNVTGLVQDQILLSFPAKSLCSNDCRGLCPRCGINLNRGACDCQEKTADPRFAALKTYQAH
jgi:uncharacterized protein